ncbi:MAG TPA: hypothetical protein VIL99_18620 [Ignavibacteria bacterium]|jgi:hypothetical protein
MTTKPPSEINYASEDSLVKKIYSVVDELKEIIPVDNERYRLGFCLNMYMDNEITDFMDAIDQADPRSSKMDYPELGKKISGLFEERGIVKS